jgi:hypothetical protein
VTTIDWKKRLARNTSDKGQHPKIKGTHKDRKRQIPNDLVKKQTKPFNRHLSKEDPEIHEGRSRSRIIRECKLEHDGWCHSEPPELLDGER